MVIITAVFIGVSSMIFMAAASKGMVYSMVNNSIKNFTGHILIRDKRFVSDPVLENRIAEADRLLTKLEKELPDADIIKRIRLDAVLNTARNTEGVSIIGTDIKREKKVSFIGDAKVEGSLPEKSGDILIGRAMSEKIGLELGKKVIISMQGADGDIASKAYRIKGIFDAGQKQQEERFVFVTFDSASGLLGIKKGATEISVVLPVNDIESDIYSTTAEKLKKVLDEKNSVMSWREVMPALSSYLDMFDSFMFIWYLVVFIAMGFGIVNTVLMAVYERVREFGLIRALGVKWTGIFKMVIAETSLMILTGVILGNVIALLLAWYFAVNGLDLTAFSSGADMFGMSRVVYPVVTVKDFMIADLTVFVLGVIIALYPAYKACSFTPVETMREM